jgi:hypothetical protein
VSRLIRLLPTLYESIPSARYHSGAPSVIISPDVVSQSFCVSIYLSDLRTFYEAESDNLICESGSFQPVARLQGCRQATWVQDLPH